MKRILDSLAAFLCTPRGDKVFLQVYCLAVALILAVVLIWLTN